MGDDKFAELRAELKNLIPRRKVESIKEVGDQIEIVFMTGGRPLDVQEERQAKMLVFQVLGKTAVVKYC